MKSITQVPNNVYKSSDFSSIRQDLINWLSNQDEFKDYDFAGSRLSILIDLLAYNTLYIQHFTNTSIYESFIKTAKLRSSVVQHAQDMGYLPDSRSSSGTQILTVIKNKTNPSQIKIPKGTKFVGQPDPTRSYDFVTWEDVTVLADSTDPDNKIYETRLDLIQGRIVRTSFEFENSTRMMIENKFIDRNHIRVYVDGAEWKDWTNESIISLSGLSKVFYTRETLEGFTEIFFGEGEGSNVGGTSLLKANYIGGLKPQVGSIITVEYISTSGEEANGSKKISYVDSLPNLEFVQIIENPDNDENYTGTAGGGDPEDIERIRELAPILRETQRRCVTSSDYESFISYRFGSIVQAIQAYTQSDKPGYAYIAIKPKDGLTLTTVQKEDIKYFLSKYNVSTITPIVTDPDYIYIRHKINVQYRLNYLSETEEWLRGKILDSIDRYYIENVELFNKSFHVSKMLSYIDNSDQSILGSEASIGLIKEIDNFYKTPMAGIKYLNQVKERSMISSFFKYVKDDNDQGYDVRYVSTDINSSDGHSGKVLVGPFKAGDITIGIEYTGNDFDRVVIDGRDKYYNVGNINYLLDKIDFDLGSLGKPSTNFKGAYIELEAIPLDNNVYAKDGALIVFENDLRPQYTTISLEPITL